VSFLNFLIKQKILCYNELSVRVHLLPRRMGAPMYNGKKVKTKKSYLHIENEKVKSKKVIYN